MSHSYLNICRDPVGVVVLAVVVEPRSFGQGILLYAAQSPEVFPWEQWVRSSWSWCTYVRWQNRLTSSSDVGALEGLVQGKDSR